MKKIFTVAIAATISMFSFKVSAQGVAVNTTGSKADTSAMLDVTSTTKGLLAPRMTKAQRDAIVTPATGLLIYQTDNTPSFYYYDGSAWVTLKGATGATGPIGATGATGPNGATGPQGPSGASTAAYGDGSAGAVLFIPAGSTVDWTTSGGFPGLNLQYSSINISGTLIVPSGIKLKSTGNVLIVGTIAVSTAAGDNNLKPHPGISTTAATNNAGGVGINKTQISSLINIPLVGGGAGARNLSSTGGEGGGSFGIYAGGNVTVFSGAVINANGNNGINPNTAGAGITGAGGGAGGLVVILSGGSISVAGTINAKGGNGASGFDGNGGNAEGAGGGGGGGIVCLLASSTPSVTGSINVTGGAAGSNAGASATINAGGGGGACGGNGGNGGITSITPASGASGYSVSSAIANPQNLF